MNTVSYLKLMRISALPTLWSNTLTAMCIGLYGWTGEPFPSGPRSLVFVFALFTASSFLYLAGMVLNDVFDARRDAVERPERPIPSGRISRASAWIFGMTLLLGGLMSVEVCSAMVPNPLIKQAGGLLALCIVAYDAFLKRIPILGAIAMGACRFLNFLFVFAAVFDITNYELERLFFEGVWNNHLGYATGVSLYIVFVTILSGFEAGRPKLQRLVGRALALLILIDVTACLVLIDIPDGLAPAGLVFLLYLSAVPLRRIVPMS